MSSPVHQPECYGQDPYDYDESIVPPSQPDVGGFRPIPPTPERQPAVSVRRALVRCAARGSVALRDAVSACSRSARSRSPSPPPRVALFERREHVRSPSPDVSSPLPQFDPLDEFTPEVEANYKAEFSPESNFAVYLLTMWQDVKPTELESLRGMAQYIACQHELCPTTGLDHWQTMFVAKNKGIKWRTVQATFARDPIVNVKSPHIVPVRNNLFSYTRVRAYCMKERTRVDGPFEWGVWPFKEKHGRGSRTDITGAADWGVANPNKQSMRQWFEAGHGEAIIKYPRLAVLQQSVLAEVELPMPSIYWFYGITKTGKSKRACLLAKELCKEHEGWRWYRRLLHSDPRWPGYDGQEVVIWDEFRENSTFQSLGAMLAILDRGRPAPTDAKWAGSFLVARVHIFTSPEHPQLMFLESMNRVHGGIDQMLRRITKIVHFEKQLEDDDDVEDVCAGAFARVMAAVPDV